MDLQALRERWARLIYAEIDVGNDDPWDRSIAVRRQHGMTDVYSAKHKQAFAITDAIIADTIKLLRGEQ